MSSQLEKNSKLIDIALIMVKKRQAKGGLAGSPEFRRYRKLIKKLESSDFDLFLDDLTPNKFDPIDIYKSWDITKVRESLERINSIYYYLNK